LFFSFINQSSQCKMIFTTSFSLRDSKIALFDKALLAAMASGALAMCAMWVGRISKFLCGG
jgi:hypothetical protein